MRTLFSVVIICVVGILVYSNMLGGAFQFDDHWCITNNPAIRNLSNLPAVWNFWPTRFITILSFALNYRLERFNVFYYHLFNLLIHLGSAILVWWLTFLALSTPEMRDKKIAGHKEAIALFAGLIFASHPIQTEAVSYIVQRATSLAGFFCLASVCLYAKSRSRESESASSNGWRYYYAASLIAAVMAAFTKEMAIMLPLAILLYDICFLNTEKAIRWKRLVPFFIILLIIPITMFATRSLDFFRMRHAAEGPAGISSGHYLLTQFRVIVTYIRLLFIPINQNVRL